MLESGRHSFPRTDQQDAQLSTKSSTTVVTWKAAGLQGESSESAFHLKRTLIRLHDVIINQIRAMYLKIKLSQERSIVGLSIENVNVNVLSVATALDVHSMVIWD